MLFSLVESLYAVHLLNLKNSEDGLKPIIFHCNDTRRVNSHKGSKLSSTGETFRFIMILNRS